MNINILMYALPSVVALISIVITKMYYSSNSKSKIKGYQSDIARSHSHILKLEVENGNLQKKVKELEDKKTSAQIIEQTPLRLVAM